MTVNRVIESNFDCLKFRRFLHEETKEMWCKLIDTCSHIRLTDSPDRVSWLLTRSGVFSVKSLYSFLITKRVSFPYRKLWNLKLPLRIKVFCWILIKDRILTKENLKKKGWKKVEMCEFCDDHETTEHLFFSCPLAKYMCTVSSIALGINHAPKIFLDLYDRWFSGFVGKDRTAIILGAVAIFWAVWKTRNKSCFQRIRPKDPTNVVLYMCNLLHVWAKLQKNGLQKMLSRGADNIAKVAREIFGQSHGWNPIRRIDL